MITINHEISCLFHLFILPLVHYIMMLAHYIVIINVLSQSVYAQFCELIVNISHHCPFLNLLIHFLFIFNYMISFRFIYVSIRQLFQKLMIIKVEDIQLVIPPLVAVVVGIQMLSSDDMDVVHVFLHLLLYSNDCLVGIRKFSCYFIVVRPEHWSDCFGLLSCLFALCAFHQFIIVL